VISNPGGSGGDFYGYTIAVPGSRGVNMCDGRYIAFRLAFNRG
jgi:hypothetical protein